MWEPLLEPGRLGLVAAPARLLRGFLQELTHFAVHRHPGFVLWCDGAHSFDPSDFAELNLVRGHSAADGADRVLIKRCMTSFQWDSTLTQHLDEKLEESPASLVVVHPFDTLWTHEEIADWEQEDYTRFSAHHLKELARSTGVPILLGVDMDRWWATHPTLAGITSGAADARWSVAAPDGRWKAVRHDGFTIDPFLRSQVTLLDFLPKEQRIPVAVPPRHERRKAKAPEASPGRPFRTRIVHPA